MACPACLVAIAGTDTSNRTVPTLPVLAGLVFAGAAAVWLMGRKKPVKRRRYRRNGCTGNRSTCHCGCS